MSKIRRDGVFHYIARKLLNGGVTNTPIGGNICKIKLLFFDDSYFLMCFSNCNLQKSYREYF